MTPRVRRAVLAVLAGIAWPAVARAGVTLTVSAGGDVDDPADGQLTLREAIRIANGDRPVGASEAAQIAGGVPGKGVAESIVFVGTSVVSLASALPALSDAGTSLDGGGVVTLMPAAAMALGAPALTASGDGISIRNLAVADGAGAAARWTAGVAVGKTVGVVVSKVTLTNLLVGVSLDGATGAVVDACQISGGDVGISVKGASAGVSISATHVTAVSTAGVSIDGGTGAIVGGKGLGNDIRAGAGAAVVINAGMGTTVGPDNVLGGAAGVRVTAAALGVRVVGNRVGVAADGAALSGLATGVAIFAAAGVLVAGNEIRNASGAGVHITGATGAVVGKGMGFPGNLIRDDGTGVLLDAAAQGNRIGPENVVGADLRDGIRLEGADTDRNTITINAVSGHAAGKPIRLVDGANAGIAAPRIISATPNQVAGTCPAPAITVELFSDPGAEAAVYLGSAPASGGAWMFVGPVPGSGHLTATATDGLGNTSELSEPLAAPSGGYELPPEPPPEAAGDGGAGDAVAGDGAGGPDVGDAGTEPGGDAGAEPPGKSGGCGCAVGAARAAARDGGFVVSVAVAILALRPSRRARRRS